jgi:phosphate acetyltransferase
VRAGEAELLMKGSLHTDELMREVVAKDTGLRTGRRVSHVFVMDVPAYPEPLFVTDAAINIFPDLEAKADIVRNAIDLHLGLGLGEPRVAILSRGRDGHAQDPQHARGGGVVQDGGARPDRGAASSTGRSRSNTAISPEAARIKGLGSEVAGRAQILVVPDPRGRQHAGEEPVLPRRGGRGRRRAGAPGCRSSSPAGPTTCAHRMASCAVAAFYAHHLALDRPIAA